jgi:anti-sigma regulatory factor (Ser/Thr protein kinase)
MPYYRCPACGLTTYSAASYSSASACPSCSAPLTEDSKLVVVPGAKHSLDRRLRAQPQAAAEARRAVVALALPEPTRATLSLVVSELVTNSIMHAGLTADDNVDLHVNNGGRRVSVTVHDPGPGFTPPEPSAGPLSVGGLGLVIADALSDSWGVDSDEHGCTVWCNIAIKDGPATTIREVTTGHGHAAEIALAVAKSEHETELEQPRPLARMNASCPP